jgi:hypothetical protein
MGFTNNVQPYCIFAIIAMQITPNTSCTHGDALHDDAPPCRSALHACLLGLAA